MNKKFKNVRKSTKSSPVLFEDEEMGTSSPDEVRIVKSVTPRNNALAGHSTPIRNKIKTDSSESPELNYNESPIEPLTQHPPSDVGWDYQRSLAKEESSKNLASVDLNKTPKRHAAFLSKKRNSNSPLLHKPLKKKLIHEEQQEGKAWLEELKAIAKQFGEKNSEVEKSGSDGESQLAVEMNSEVQKDGSDGESQLIVEMDSEPSGGSDIKLQVSANTNESPGQNKVVTVNKNNDALLDDSIEEMLVLCSQQVEAKEFGIEENQNIMQLSTNTWRKNTFLQTTITSCKKGLKNLPKENLQPLNNNDNIISNTSSKNSSSSKGESCSSGIPDDSFDNVVFDFDDFCPNNKTEIVVGNVNKLTKYYNNQSCPKSTSSTVTMTTKDSIQAQNKFFQSKNSTIIKQTKVVASNTNCNYSNMSNALVQNKVLNAKANFGYLNEDYIKSSSSSEFDSMTQTTNSDDKNNDTRLFKSKSYSDSNFFNQNSSINNFEENCRIRASNGLTISQQSANKYPVKHNSVPSSTSENKSWRRVHSSSSISESSIGNNSDQLSTNRMSNSAESLPLSTPAEIERKRRQAIMKRNARMQQMLGNCTLKRPTQNQMKR